MTVNIFKTAVWTLILTLILWGVMSWPLPIHVASGIPSSADNIENTQMRTMVAGDHLQFLYHMWLAKDTFFGPTKLFYNTYEFNRGDEEERRNSTMRYYLPFALFFSAFAPGGHPLAWNMTGFISLWISLIFTFMLARRYTKDPACAALSAAIGIILPYRWFTLMGGSPTGLSMMWIPISLYGLDVMIRDKKAWGSCLAGFAIFFAGWSDPHVTFFAGLTAPCWCIISYLFHRQKLMPDKKEIITYLKTAIPLVLFAIAVIIQAKGTKDDLAKTVIVDAGRTIGEIALFSPVLKGVIFESGHPTDRQIYIGLILGILIIAGLAATAYRTWKKQVHPVRVLAPALLLFLGIGTVIILSTGVNNPWGVLFWQRLCKLLPPYGMIRQPAKIYIVLPTLIAMFMAITGPNMLAVARLNRKSLLCCSLIGLILTLNFAQRINPSICKLDTQQGAYSAVVEDAEKSSITPHILCLPLWPGDSHWASINQHYVSLYRIRMVNGYRPTRREDYVDDIYTRFESFNKGGYSNEQLDNLVGRGVHYIVLHEDAFPEKVSHFSVSHTIYQLLAHPRIKLLAQDKAVWAFKIVDEQDGIYENLPEWNYHAPARLWQAERSSYTNAEALTSPDTSGTKYLKLLNGSSYTTTQSYPAPSIDKLCYMVRTRGGSYNAEVTAGGRKVLHKQISSAQNQWQWQVIPIQPFDSYQRIQLKITPTDKPLDVDLTVLATSDWDPACFRHVACRSSR
jgi:hypothetical protein